MSESRGIVAATDADRAVISRMLADAFHDDPVFGWMLRDPAARRVRMPKLFDVMFRVEQKYGGVLKSATGECASFWRPPGKAVTPTTEFLRRAWPLVEAFGPALPRLLAVSNAVEAHLPRDQPFWYAHFVGVSPSQQRQGWGAAMMRVGIERARNQGLAVYLETARPENVSFYLGLGFEVVAEWNVPKGPHFWSMTHQP